MSRYGQRSRLNGSANANTINYWFGSGFVYVPKATGGDITFYSSGGNNYFIHTFTSNGTFTPTQSLTADYLVVAGGGGGGAGYSATGAGAGGLRSTLNNTGGLGTLETALSLTAQAYTVTVGGGGTGGTSQGNGTQGVDSVFSSITSAGGGRGTYAVTANAGSGIAGGSGSGSAGFAVSTTGGAASPAGQGFRGGHITVSNGPWPAGTGGGGAGAVGGPGTGGSSSPNAVGSAGGIGVSVSISGTSVIYAQASGLPMMLHGMLLSHPNHLTLGY
jgi:hypothetical protein